MNYLDLFSGCGGFRRGLEEAGYTFEWEGHSEIDKWANQVYEKHYPQSEALGDVREIKIHHNSQSTAPKSEPAKSKIQFRGKRSFKEKRPDNLSDRYGEYTGNRDNGEDYEQTTITTPNGTFTLDGKIDLITFGFPCQDLSIAGKRGGLEASRSGLFFEAMRIVRDAKPGVFIFENVMGLFSKSPARNIIDKREWFLKILREVADAGYDGQWQVLNTRWFLPQNRERIFFVGYPRTSRRPQIFPIGEESKNAIKSQERTKGKGQRIWSRDYTGCLRSAGVDDGMSTLIQIHQRGRGFNKGGDKDICPTITGTAFEQNHTVSGIRRLTPIECARLQGFQDDWHGDVSDSQAYKMYGNAVSVPVVKAVVERIRAEQLCK